MTIQKINLGSSPKGEGGDKWREGSNKINANFNYLDERVALAKSVADSKTTNATDAHLLNRSNHTGTQSISTILGLQAALDSAASQIDITGNAATATKLATAVNINGVPFDGSQSISIGGTGEGGTGAIYSVMTNTEAQQGTSTSEKVITPAILKSAIQYHAPEQTDISGNAATASKLASAVNINGVPFDGSQSINITYAAMTGMEAQTGTGTTEKTITPAVLKSAIQYHAPEQTDISGNAATATKLAIARNIGGVSFDGSDNINLPGVNTVGNQDTTGNAATAGKLQTPVKINGIDFDGTTDITVGADSNAARKIIAACVYTPASYFGGSCTLISKNISAASEDWVMQANLAIIPFKVGDIVSMVFIYRTGYAGSMTYNGDTIITAINGSLISFSTPGVSGYRDNSNTNVSIGAFISDSNNILSITKNTDSYSVTLESNQNGNNLSLIVDATSIGSTTKLHSTQTASTDLSASFELFYYSIVSNALAATKTVDAKFRILVIA